MSVIKYVAKQWTFSSHFKFEVILFATAFLIRALYAVAIQWASGPSGFLAFSDAEFFYYRSAINLFENHAFSLSDVAPYFPDAYHTPLYSIFIGIPIALKLPLLAVVLLQNAVAALSVVLIYKIGMLVTGSQRVSFWAGVIACVEPMSIYWSGLLMSDVFFAFLLILSFYFLLRGGLVGTALVLGFAALTRPIALLFIPAYLAYAGYMTFRETRDIRRVLISVILLFVVCAAVISPWFARNKILFDTWEYTSAGWYDLYVSPVNQFAAKRGIVLPQIIIETEGGTQAFHRFDFQYTPLYKNAVLSVMSADFSAFVAFQAERSLYALVSNRYHYLVYTVIGSKFPTFYSSVPESAFSALLIMGTVFWVSVYVLAAAGILDRRLRPWALFTGFLVAVNAGISGGINPGGTDMSRYSLALDAMVLILAAATADRVIKYISHSKSLICDIVPTK